MADAEISNEEYHTEFTKTVTIKDSVGSIWNAKQENCVWVGGFSGPSITFVEKSGNTQRYEFKAGRRDRIEHGLAIGLEYHVVNVYDTLRYSTCMYCVKIDPNSTGTQLSPISTFCKGEMPECVLTIDGSHIGVYCRPTDITCRVDVFAMSDVMTKPNPAPTKGITLAEHSVHDRDSLCVNSKGEIYVASYLSAKVHIYNKDGTLTKTIGSAGIFSERYIPGGLFRPRYIKCFSNDSFAVACERSETHRFDGVDQWSIVKHRDTHVKKATQAVITKTMLWIIDGDNQTKIHTYNTNLSN